MKETFKNWIASPKTTLGAVITLVSTVLFAFKKIDSTVFISIIGVCAGWIGLSASDNKTT